MKIKLSTLLSIAVFGSMIHVINEMDKKIEELEEDNLKIKWDIKQLKDFKNEFDELEEDLDT